MNPNRGPPMTLGIAAAAGARLIVCCRECQHQFEPDPAEMAARYGAETSVLDWRQRLACSPCGGRQVDMVVTITVARCTLRMPDKPPRHQGCNDRSAGHEAQRRLRQITTRRLPGQLRHDDFKAALQIGDVGAELISLP
jgi:hypothetical protein